MVLSYPLEGISCEKGEIALCCDIDGAIWDDIRRASYAQKRRSLDRLFRFTQTKATACCK